MTQPPANPKVYHITPVDNLASMAAASELWSDSRVRQRGGPPSSVGMAKIKNRRLLLPVGCHPGTVVGDFVPFYFCPRSIMLYLLHMGNHPELNYSGGQEPIVHLMADLRTVVQWADQYGRRWAFTAANAGAAYTSFHSDLGQLGQIDWAAVGNRDFRSQTVKEGKQAEFLLHDTFPWQLIEHIGVYSRSAALKTHAAIAGAAHRPRVRIEPMWYY